MKVPAPRAALTALIVGCVAATGCTSGGSDEPSTTTGRVDAARMSRWVDTLVDFGIRRPGYPGDNRAAAWIEAEFERAGLQNVRRDPVEVNRWTPDDCSVTWWSDAAPQ